MRNILLVFGLLIIFSSFSPTYQNDLIGKAEVDKLQGFDIYMYSEPMADYDIIDDMNSGTGMIAAAFDAHIDLNTIVKGFIAKARKKNKKAEKQGEDLIDAIIIYDMEKAVGIKYTE